MMKILMVCLGNICRSPLAEGLMRQKLNKFHIDGEVNSCGFESFHIGDSPDYRSIQVASAHGVDITQHRGIQFKPSFFDYYDRIYVMDRHNYMDVISKARNENDKKKVDFIMNAVYPGKNTAVPDPYYGQISDFEKTWELLDMATEKIAESMINKQKRP